jgi:hypothetical protein
MLVTFKYFFHCSLYTYKLNIIFISLAVLTLCACTPPLEQVLKLWDFLLAYGVHLNILCVIAQLILIRDQLLEAQRYVEILLLFYICVFPILINRIYYLAQ